MSKWRWWVVSVRRVVGVPELLEEVPECEVVAQM